MLPPSGRSLEFPTTTITCVLPEVTGSFVTPAEHPSAGDAPPPPYFQPSGRILNASEPLHVHSPSGLMEME